MPVGLAIVPIVAIKADEPLYEEIKHVETICVAILPVSLAPKV